MTALAPRIVAVALAVLAACGVSSTTTAGRDTATTTVWPVDEGSDDGGVHRIVGVDPLPPDVSPVDEAQASDDGGFCADALTLFETRLGLALSDFLPLASGGLRSDLATLTEPYAAFRDARAAVFNDARNAVTAAINGARDNVHVVHGALNALGAAFSDAGAAFRSNPEARDYAAGVVFEEATDDLVAAEAAYEAARAAAAAFGFVYTASVAVADRDASYNAYGYIHASEAISAGIKNAPDFGLEDATHDAFAVAVALREVRDTVVRPAVDRAEVFKAEAEAVAAAVTLRVSGYIAPHQERVRAALLGCGIPEVSVVDILSR